jgi:hypothetical protein
VLKYLSEVTESSTVPAASQLTKLEASKGLKTALEKRADLSHAHMVYCKLGIGDRYMYLL